MNQPTAKPNWIDVSVGLSPATPLWPTMPPVEFSHKETTLSDGSILTSSQLRMSPHCGTHIDAPLHFARNGKTIDALDLDLLMGPCLVLEHTGDGHITKSDLMAMGFTAAQRLLLKTRNSKSLRQGTFDRQNFLSLMPDAIEHLMQSGVQLLGVDGLSIGPYGELTNHNHVLYCGAGGVILEVLDLFDVEPGPYDIIALPVKLQDFEAAPARVLLFPPGLFGRET